MKVRPVEAALVHVDSGQTNMTMLMAFCSFANMPTIILLKFQITT